MKHHSGKYYIAKAEKAGLRVENGRGDHMKVFGPAGRGYMVVPIQRELSNGVEHAIVKWFARLGILVTLAIAGWVGYLAAAGVVTP